MLEIHQLVTEQSDDTLPCIPPGTNFVHCPAEVSTHTKIKYLDHTPQSQEMHQALNDLCGEYKDIFSLHQGDIGYT